MAVIETLHRASFDGDRFPFERRTITGGVRHHVHVFPHSPGGEPEKMGRSLYEIEFHCQFHQCPGDPMDFFYPQIYPDKLEVLRNKWERQVTGDLAVPGLGVIKAFCTNWTQTLDARIASGEEVTIKFLEDQDAAVVTAAVPKFDGLAMEAAAKQMNKPSPELPKKPSIFQQINDVITQIQAIEAAGDIANKLLEAKLLAMVSLCAGAEQTVHELQDPLNHGIFAALKEVWLMASLWLEDIQLRQSPIHVWTVTKKMSVTEISAAIYGDGSHVEELLDLNTIADPLAVPAGTPIRFYAA